MQEIREINQIIRIRISDLQVLAVRMWKNVNLNPYNKANLSSKICHEKEETIAKTYRKLEKLIRVLVLALQIYKY